MENFGEICWEIRLSVLDVAILRGRSDDSGFARDEKRQIPGRSSSGSRFGYPPRNYNGCVFRVIRI
jgi:hypothetical protein